MKKIGISFIELPNGLNYPNESGKKQVWVDKGRYYIKYKGKLVEVFNPPGKWYYKTRVNLK